MSGCSIDFNACAALDCEDEGAKPEHKALYQMFQPSSAASVGWLDSALEVGI